MSSSVKKRKRSSTPTRKKARTGAEATGASETCTTRTETTANHVTPAPRPLVGTPVGVRTAPAARSVPVTKPKNPHAGMVKQLRANFGTGYHDTAHFKATADKADHGVWQGTIPQVKNWVGMALDSIYLDDPFVVASTPGANGGYTYLVAMDGTTVGYLSGASVEPGANPPAQHVEVYLNRKGNTVSAFPSSPDIF
jgi:hypothetical protein